MVSKEIVMGTIKRMHDAGIDNETIKSSLRDIGLSEAEISSYLSEAGLEAKAVAKEVQKVDESAEESAEEVAEDNAEEALEETQEPEPSALEEEDNLDEDFSLEDSHEIIAEKTAEKLKPHIESIRQEQGLRDVSYKLSSEEHKERLGTIDNKIDELSSSVPSHEHIAELTARVKALEELVSKTQRDISDIKAMSSALQSLLTKILDTDRQTLIAVSKKKS